MKRSGEITNELVRHPEGQPLYEQLQRIEVALQVSKDEFDSRLAAFSNSRVYLETMRKELANTCQAGVLLAEANGSPQARILLDSDVKDEQGMAADLVKYIQDIPDIGEGLTKSLTKKRLRWLAAETELEKVGVEFASAVREYSALYHHAGSALEQGRSILTSLGTPASKPKRTRAHRHDRKPLPVETATPRPNDRLPTLVMVPEEAVAS